MLLLLSAVEREGKITLTENNKDLEKEELQEEVTSETETHEENEVSVLKEKLEEMEDKYLRVNAELQNIVRRNKENRELLTRYRSQDLAKDILPVIDNLERAMDIDVTDEAGQSLKQGVQMVLDSFYRALESNNIETIEAEGQPFDPNFHEAYAQVPGEDGQESGVVAQVYEKGYKLHDRVLRAAKVTVTQ